MSDMKQENVERIAAEYIKNIGTAPFIIDGSEFDDSVPTPMWRVHISFCERSEEWVGFPDSLVVEVNDATGEASHTASL